MDSKISSLWYQTPVIIRAPLTGFLVFVVMQFIWGFPLAFTQVLPEIPWSPVLSLVLLWLSFKYFNGKWLPKSTSDQRKLGMRANPLSREQWKWAIVCLTAFVFVFRLLIVINYRLVEFPPNSLQPPSFLNDLELWVLIPTVIALAFGAGVSEEAGVHGYMQGADRKYGPVVGITVAGSFFWLMHGSHPDFLERFLPLFLSGISAGILTFLTNSIIPSMIAHIIIDISGAFILWVFREPDSFPYNNELIWTTGLDSHFVIYLFAFSLATGLMIFCFRKLSHLRDEST